MELVVLVAALLISMATVDLCPTPRSNKNSKTK